MIEQYGWWAFGFTVVGLIVSSHTAAYFFGFKRGLGQFRLSNPFGPAPIVEKPDPQIVHDYRMLKSANQSLNYMNYQLEKQYKNLLAERDGLIEKMKASDLRRAKRASNAK